MSLTYKHPSLKATGEVAFDVNALCDVEQQLGVGINDVLTKMRKPGGPPVNVVRALVWAGLARLGSAARVAGPSITRPSIDQVGDMMAEVGIKEATEDVAFKFGAYIKQLAEK